MNTVWKAASAAGVLFVAVGILISCGGGGSGGPDPEPLPAKVDPSTPGYLELGCGTDVFEEYASENNVKGKVLDVDALNDARLLVLNESVQEGTIQRISGSTISEYSNSLGVTVGLSGSYMWFSASAQMAFTDNTYRRSEFSYVTLMERHYKNSLKIENTTWPAEYLKTFVTAAAKQAINDTDTQKQWPPEELIATFGTHVMVGIFTGARLDYNLSIDVSSTSHQNDIQAYAEMKAGTKLASASFSTEFSQTTYDEMTTLDQRENIQTKGGNGQYANPADDDDYQIWKASIDTDPALVGIIKNALVPIWELADTNDRQQEILDYYYQYASGKESAFIPLIQKVTAVQLHNTGKSSSITIDPGWTLLQDINGNTADGYINANIYRGGAADHSNTSPRGDYIWVSVKSEVTDQPGISELHILSSDPTFNQGMFGSSSHDDLYGVDAPGCVANSTVNLNADTCASGYNNEYYSSCCAYYFWNPRCNQENTLQLYLHYQTQEAGEPAARCVVLGNSVAIDQSKPTSERQDGIFWAPADANADGVVNSSDALYVLDHVQWVRNSSNGTPVNLNSNTQSYRSYNWYRCAWICTDSGWDSGWIHNYEDSRDAQYLGYCLE